MKWLCKLGLHRWRDLWVSQISDTEADVLHKCLRCGVEEKIRLWGPLSGPHKPKWHPDRDRRMSR